MAQRLKTDWILFATVIAMAAFGMLMLYSASAIMADLSRNSSWYFVSRQMIWAVISIPVMMALKRTNYRTYQTPAIAFGAISLALILLAVVYFVDAEHHRWLRFKQFGLMQPSELAKPALVVFLAFFVTWRGPAINNPRYTLIPAALAVGLVIFAVETADLGTAVVLAAAAMGVFFVAGLNWRYCLIAAGIAVLGLGVSIAREPYRLGRVVRHWDPKFEFVSKFDKAGRIKAWAEQSLRTRDTNYQQEQSEIAIGAGGIKGVGLMNGRQKLLYLPEAHTDFIYAVVGEELGIFGAVGLLAGFIIILWRGFRAAFRIRDEFGRYLALGVTIIIVVQAFINISVAVGLGPTKGIPLPLISSGGSSLLSTLALLGILMNVSEHAG
jgi:cell division protein FtsW